MTAGWWAFTWTGRSDGESMVCRHLHGSSLQSLTLGRCQDRKSHFRVFNAGLFVYISKRDMWMNFSFPLRSMHLISASITSKFGSLT